MLYYLNYLCKYITPNGIGDHLTSDLKSEILIILVSMCILPLTAIWVASEAMAACKQPRRSDLTSQIQLSYINYIWFHVSLACKGLHELNATQGADYHP